MLCEGEPGAPLPLPLVIERRSLGVGDNANSSPLLFPSPCAGKDAATGELGDSWCMPPDALPEDVGGDDIDTYAQLSSKYTVQGKVLHAKAKPKPSLSSFTPYLPASLEIFKLWKTALEEGIQNPFL